MRDDQLARYVRDELEWNPRVEADHIGVDVNDGEVTLSGIASSYIEKHAAVRAAERVYGVRVVADEIEVRVPAADVRDDTDIGEALDRALCNDVSVPAAVKAEVRDGAVTLRGTVEWRYQRREAERLARHTKGVAKLVNLITVRPKVTAEDVEKRIGAALRRSADLDARSIWVTAEDGMVRLHGHVHSFSELDSAEEAAFAAPGVATVDNRITVQP